MTARQLAATKLVAEKHWSVTRAMKKVKYAPSTYSKPKNLTESNGYKKFVGYLADDKYVAKKVNEGLEAYERDHFSGEFQPDFSEIRQTAKLIGEFKGYLKTDFNFNQQINIPKDIVFYSDDK